VISPDKQTFLIADTRPLSSQAVTNSADASVHPSQPDSVANQLERQKSLPSPAWQGKELLVALGDSLEMNPSNNSQLFGYERFQTRNRIATTAA
jgi:hypothetical protein